LKIIDKLKEIRNLATDEEILDYLEELKIEEIKKDEDFDSFGIKGISFTIWKGSMSLSIQAPNSDEIDLNEKDAELLANFLNKHFNK
jgi:hypothetical protein